jgi:NO-binding membrane sensor protein with MHYT domain
LGVFVKIRNCVLALSFAVLVMGSVKEANALPAPDPVVVGGTTAGAGLWITGGFIGAVAVLCAYDIVLKINGVKNWDGTPKKLVRTRH